MALEVFAFNCTLKRGNRQSSTQKLLRQVMDAFKKHGAEGEIVRAVDHNIKPGTDTYEGPGDAWPKLRTRLLSADIFVLGTPIWMGHPCSVAQRIIERMDAFLDETDEQDRMPSFGKVAVAAIVGNEDGAHHCSAEIFQGLNDVGFTIPSCGVTYWVGEAMGDKNYVDLKHTPREVAKATDMMVRNAVHLATLLRSRNYPGKD
jgi:multimeric flavodoxin WrbA